MKTRDTSKNMTMKTHNSRKNDGKVARPSQAAWSPDKARLASVVGGLTGVRNPQNMTCLAT